MLARVRLYRQVPLETVPQAISGSAYGGVVRATIYGVSDFLPQLLENWDIAEYPWSAPRIGCYERDLAAGMGGRARVVLRRHRRPGRAEVEFEHRALAHARSGGVPCPAIVPTRRGGSLVEEDGRFYSLYTWAPGLQVLRGDFGAEHAESMGSMRRTSTWCSPMCVAAPRLTIR